MRISIPRGDIKLVQFIIYAPDRTISDIDFDEISFNVKKTPLDQTYLIQKKLTDDEIEQIGTGSYQLKILPEDTENLSYGKYKFSVKVEAEDIKSSYIGDFIVTENI